MGARFTPCIRPLPDYTSSTTFAYCYQSQSDTCTLEQLCGFDGFGSSDVPNQSFRFITPIFLHAGIIHYIINMLSHFSFGDLERSLGTPRYTILYMASGIWGFVLSATLSQTTTGRYLCPVFPYNSDALSPFNKMISEHGLFRGLVWYHWIYVCGRDCKLEEHCESDARAGQVAYCDDNLSRIRIASWSG